MLGYYNYTVVLTYCGMLTAFYGITQAVAGNIFVAVVCLMTAGLCDMFDGKIAATKKDRTKSQKSFGIQIDSLGDLICFGVLPAVIVYELTRPNPLCLFIAGMYVLCALIRLAYFNVDEAERQEATDEARTVYLGLPVTTSALILPLVLYLCYCLHWSEKLLPPLTLVAAGCMFLAPVPIKKPGNVGKVIMILIGLSEFILILWGVKNNVQ